MHQDCFPQQPQSWAASALLAEPHSAQQRCMQSQREGLALQNLWLMNIMHMQNNPLVEDVNLEEELQSPRTSSCIEPVKIQLFQSHICKYTQCLASHGSWPHCV